MKPGQISDDAREQLEEAGLSVLMKEYLGIEEARLEGETMRLNSDAEFLYPAALDEKCRREIDRHFAREKRRAAMRAFRKAARVAAAAILLAALVCAALLLARHTGRAGMIRGGVDMPFEAMFSVMFVLVVVGFFVLIIRGIAQWTKNNAAPRLAVEAAVVAKRADISQTTTPAAGDPTGAHGYASHISTSYRVTFQVESGDRMEFSVPGSEYGLLAEGDFGKLSFQGTRYLSFEKK